MQSLEKVIENTHHLTILFVEREVLARNIIRTFLQPNYSLLIAANGNEALEVSRRYVGEIHVLVSGEEKVGLDGIPVHCRIRAERPKIRILPVVGESQEFVSSCHLPLFLTRPFQLGILHTRLNEVLERDAGRYSLPSAALVSRLRRILQSAN